jgi:polysaccharide pyruvyl transferase WcaK-like protein
VPVARELVDAFGGEIDLYVPDGLDDARAVIASAQVLIGARMHACLNALSTGVPAVAMAYSRKFEPLMRSIEWRHVVSLTSSDEPAQEVLRILRDPQLKAQAERTMVRGQQLLAPALTLLRGLD